MVEATTGWIKAGYSDEDAAQLARFSALLQNTADEQLSGAEATSILVSQLKAYGLEVEDAIKVTDIINKVSAEHAVSSGDISKGLTVASASMATFGNSIEATTALLTAGTTINMKSRYKTLLIDGKLLKTYLPNYNGNIYNGNV